MVSKKRNIVILAFVAVLLCTFMLVKFSRYENRQNQKISALENQMRILKEEASSNEFVQNCKGGGNYLAIGNSITKHGICDYWWNEIGMAATKEENDYFHLVCSELTKEYGNVNSFAYNFSIWETQSADRAETLAVLDPYLTEEIDLVTIQLGENATNLKTLETDFLYLLEYIQEKVPEAQMIVIGDFWEYKERDSLKEKAADSCGVPFIDLSEIKDNTEYECGIGTVVFDAEGKSHTVEHEGVAGHPNDKAMGYIAEKIINVLNRENGR